MTDTTKPIRLKKDGTPWKAWTASGKPRKTKAGNGEKFPIKLQLAIHREQHDALINAAKANNKSLPDFLRDLFRTSVPFK